jgi:hypothetical protein
MLNKAYECGLCGTIRHYKEVVGAISNGRRHGKSAVQIATEQIAEFVDIRVFGMFLRGPMLFRREAEVTARRMIFVSNMHAINDFWGLNNVAVIHMAETAMPSRLARGR